MTIFPAPYSRACHSVQVHVRAHVRAPAVRLFSLCVACVAGIRLPREKVMSTTTIIMLIIYAVVFGGGSFYLVSYSLKRRNDETMDQD